MDFPAREVSYFLSLRLAKVHVGVRVSKPIGPYDPLRVRSGNTIPRRSDS